MKKEKLQNILMLLTTIAVLIICGAILFRHRSASAPAGQGNSDSQKSAADSFSSPSDTNALPDENTPAGQIYYAFQNLLQQPVFQVSTDATIRLKGKMIHGVRQIHSDVDIADASSNSLQMNMTTETTAGNKTERSHAAYYQGWYCTDSGKKFSRVQKSQEDILSMVTFVSNILQNASDQLEDMVVTTEGTDTIYQFTLPEYYATIYFCQLVERAAMDTKELKHVTGQVTEMQMTCRVSKDHILIGQQASITGTVSKSLFTVPAALKATSSFTLLDPEDTITPPDLEKYPIQE